MAARDIGALLGNDDDRMTRPRAAVSMITRSAEIQTVTPISPLVKDPRITSEPAFVPPVGAGRSASPTTAPQSKRPSSPLQTVETAREQPARSAQASPKPTPAPTAASTSHPARGNLVAVDEADVPPAPSFMSLLDVDIQTPNLIMFTPSTSGNRPHSNEVVPLAGYFDIEPRASVPKKGVSDALGGRNTPLVQSPLSEMVPFPSTPGEDVLDNIVAPRPQKQSLVGPSPVLSDVEMPLSPSRVWSDFTVPDDLRDLFTISAPSHADGLVRSATAPMTNTLSLIDDDEEEHPIPDPSHHSTNVLAGTGPQRPTLHETMSEPLPATTPTLSPVDISVLDRWEHGGGPETERQPSLLEPPAPTGTHC